MYTYINSDNGSSWNRTVPIDIKPPELVNLKIQCIIKGMYKNEIGDLAKVKTLKRIELEDT